MVDAERPQVLIVRDTRDSGPMLEAALAAGIAQGGGDALLGGVLPTPAASVLVRRHGLDLGAVVSASHNPWQDNGIKFFGPDGTKLDDALEERIEGHVAERLAEAGAGRRAPESAAAIGRVRALEAALADYLRELSTAFPLDLSGRRVAIDCAHGATYRAAPAIFERLGADVEAIGTEPDGRNINEGVGSTHPEALAELVAGGDAEIGFAFDGDGDRVIAVDGSGGCARRRRADRDRRAPPARRRPSRRRRRGHRDDQLRLPQGDGGGRASTSRSTDVGDRHVAAALRERGLDPRRRAVGPSDLDRATRPPATASPRRCCCLRRSATGRSRTRSRSSGCRSCCETSRCATATRSRAPRPCGRRSSARTPRSRAAAGCSCARRAPSRWSG